MDYHRVIFMVKALRGSRQLLTFDLTLPGVAWLNKFPVAVLVSQPAIQFLNDWQGGSGRCICGKKPGMSLETEDSNLKCQQFAITVTPDAWRCYAESVVPLTIGVENGLLVDLRAQRIVFHRSYERSIQRRICPRFVTQTLHHRRPLRIELAVPLDWNTLKIAGEDIKCAVTQ